MNTKQILSAILLMFSLLLFSKTEAQVKNKALVSKKTVKTNSKTTKKPSIIKPINYKTVINVPFENEVNFKSDLQKEESEPNDIALDSKKIKSDSTIVEDNHIYNFEIGGVNAPEFKDGLYAFKQFFSKNFKISKSMNSDNINLVMRFVIEKDGTISNIDCYNSTDSASCEEGKRVMSICPKWKPGLHKGKIVRCFSTQIIKIINNQDD